MEAIELDPPDPFLESISGVIAEVWTLLTRSPGREVVILKAPRSECAAYLRSIWTVKGPIVSCCMMELETALELASPTQRQAISKNVESLRKKGKKTNTVLWWSETPFVLFVRLPDGSEISPFDALSLEPRPSLGDIP